MYKFRRQHSRMGRGYGHVRIRILMHELIEARTHTYTYLHPQTQNIKETDTPMNTHTGNSMKMLLNFQFIDRKCVYWFCEHLHFRNVPFVLNVSEYRHGSTKTGTFLSENSSSLLVLKALNWFRIRIGFVKR